MGPLMREGAQVDGVSNGREALMLCRRRPFDVVVIGLELPDTSGDVLIRAVRAVSSPACIVVTGATEPLSTRARRLGADRIFSKAADWRAVVAYLRDRELTRAA
jgi:DNA-binding response OmpR family regulator